MSQCSFMITEEVQAMPQIKIRIEKGVQTAGDGQEQQEAFGWRRVVHDRRPV